jgi:hypothetical protein
MVGHFALEMEALRMFHKPTATAGIVLLWALLIQAPEPASALLSREINRRQYASRLAATLTDRQLQFWEDVEDGLDDIANFWEKKNQNIDRIRVFGKR